MILGSRPRFALAIVGYQFPSIRGDGTGKDWDANWLIIAGDAVAENGRSWSFQDPCLTTSEARRLGGWLRGVVDGSVLPTPFDGGDAAGLLTFTEPNIAFSLAERSAQELVVLVHLSLESRSPWLAGSTSPGLFEYFLRLRMPTMSMAFAVQNWERLVIAFPSR